MKRPKNIILVFADGSYKGYNLKAFLTVFKAFADAEEKKWSMRL